MANRSSLPAGVTFAIVAGISVVPAISFQSHLLLRAGQCLIALLFAAASGRRIRLMPSLLLLIAVTGVHLATPTGRILFRVLGLPITLGSLETGLSKSLLLIGLVYVSRSVVRTEWIMRPGSRSFAALVLADFDALTRRREEFRATSRRLSISRLVRSIDDLFVELGTAPRADAGAETATEAGSEARMTNAISDGIPHPGWLVPFALIEWGLLVLGFIGRIPDFIDLV